MPITCVQGRECAEGPPGNVRIAMSGDNGCAGGRRQVPAGTGVDAAWQKAAPGRMKLLPTTRFCQRRWMRTSLRTPKTTDVIAIRKGGSLPGVFGCFPAPDRQRRMLLAEVGNGLDGIVEQGNFSKEPLPGFLRDGLRRGAVDGECVP